MRIVRDRVKIHSVGKGGLLLETYSVFWCSVQRCLWWGKGDQHLFVQVLRFGSSSDEPVSPGGVGRRRKQ